jgi:hypothetical protein
MRRQWPVPRGGICGGPLGAGMRWRGYFGASGQSPEIGPNASAPLMTFTTL